MRMEVALWLVVLWFVFFVDRSTYGAFDVFVVACASRTSLYFFVLLESIIFMKRWST